MSCTYTLKRNNNVVLNNVSESEINGYIRDNISDYSDYSNETIRYQKSFDELTKSLTELDNKNAAKLKEDRILARSAALRKALNPLLEDTEAWKDNATSILTYSELLAIKHTGEFNVDTWRRNKHAQLAYDRNLLRDMLPNLNNVDLNLMPEELFIKLVDRALDEEIAFWDTIRSLGKGLHYTLDVVMHQLGDTRNLDPEKIYNKAQELIDSLGTGDANLGNNKQLVLDYIKQLVDIKTKIIFKRLGKHKIYTNFVIDDTTLAGEKIRGKIDLMVVYEDGSVDIYDLKISNSDIDNWDINKKKTYNYQLGYYKRLLAKWGIPNRKINTYIIPVKLNKNTNNVIDAIDILEPVGIVNEIDELTQINSDIRLEQATLENHIIDVVSNKLTSFFPPQLFNRTLQKRSIESMERIYLKSTNSGKWNVHNPYSPDDRNLTFDTREEAVAYLTLMLEEITNIIKETTAHITNLLDANLKDRNKNGVESLRATMYLGFRNILPDRFKGHAYASKLDMHLTPYKFSAGWRVISSDELVDMGVIVLVNDITKQVDVISITNCDLFSKVDIGNNTDNLLGLKDASIKRSPMKNNVGNIEIIKAIAILDELLATDAFSDYLINLLKLVSMSHENSYLELDVDRAIDVYRRLCLLNNQSISSELNTISREERAFIAYENIQKLDSDRCTWGNMLKVNSEIENRSIADSLTKMRLLSQIRDLINEKFFWNKGPTETSDPTAVYLYELISTELAFLNGTGVDLLNEDAIKEFGVGEKALKKRILLNGVDFQSIDTIPIIRGIYKTYWGANKKIRTRYTEYKNKDRAKTKEFLGFTATSNKVINLSLIDYRSLFDTSEEGKSNFLVKNPYDLTNDLNDKQRKYLRNWLAEINAYRYKLDPEKLRTKGLDWWESLDGYKAEIEELIANGKYFEIPLANASATSTWVNSGWHKIDKIYKKGLETINNPNDNIVLDEFDEDIEIKENTNLGKMYNNFNSTDNNPDTRKRKIALGDPMELFETNLELVKDMYIFSKIREQEYNKVLPAINDAIVLIGLVTKLTGKPSEDLIKFIVDYMKSAVFNLSLVEGEMKNVIAHANQIRKITSMSVLGFNWLSGMRETATGFYSLMSKALANSLFDDNRVGIGDLTKAYAYVWVDSLKQINNVTLFEHLNRLYGIANTDINNLVDESNYSAASGFRFSHNMFWCNRAPDYLNRMTILVGYLIKQGSLEAYEFDKEGNPKYNWRKDKRFLKYANGDKSDIDEYNNQRALFRRLRQEFIKDGALIFDEKLERYRDLTENDEYIPEAFTDRDGQKIKTESDSMFGYMDHDTKSLWFRRSYGILFGQFLTYMTAKKNQYLLKRDYYGDGKWTHMENDKGEKLYFDANGKVTTEKTDEPVWDWKGSVNEGIFWSLVDLAKFFTDRKQCLENMKDPVKRRNLFILGEDALIVALLIMLAKWIMGDETSRSKLDFGASIAHRITTNMRRDINPLEVFLGVTDVSIMSLDFTKDLVSDTWQLITGDINGLRSIMNTLGPLRPFNNIIGDVFAKDS